MFIFLCVNNYHLNPLCPNRQKTPGEVTEICDIIKMMFIKEESEEITIEEAVKVKHEASEEQTGQFNSQQSSVLIEMLTFSEINCTFEWI